MYCRELGGSCKLILDVIKCEPPAVKVCVSLCVIIVGGFFKSPSPLLTIVMAMYGNVCQCLF